MVTVVVAAASAVVYVANINGSFNLTGTHIINNFLFAFALEMHFAFSMKALIHLNVSRSFPEYHFISVCVSLCVCVCVSCSWYACFCTFFAFIPVCMKSIY